MIYTKTSVIINDQHLPFIDKKANDLAFQLIKTIKPDYIDILGDLIDFYQISSFDKSPDRKHTIQDDIDIGKEYLTTLRELSPKSKITLHYGNHMYRLRKYIWRMAKELDCIRSLNLKWLLGLDKLKITAIESASGYDRRGKLCLTHGTLVSQDSAMTARRMLKKYGISVIHGHTHRLGSTFKTDLLGTRGAWENGCLCRLDLIKQWGFEIGNWQQGVSVIFFSKDRFLVQQLPIIKNKMMFGSQKFECNNRAICVQ